VKKPVDVVVVMDISGSMEGEKISSARTSLAQFIAQLDDRDRLQVNLFNDKLTTLSPLTAVGEKRDDLTRRVSGVFEGGGTALYDAILAAHADLTANGDPGHIRAIVVLSDGQDTASGQDLSAVVDAIGRTAEEGGNAIKLFTIAFGDDADEGVLKQIAEASGGREYKSDPKTIDQIYADIATFF
jgi:Ca-activated chloride channel family protein